MWFEPQHGRHRRRGAVEGPVETAKGDHRRADRALCKGDQPAEVQTAIRGGVASDQNTRMLAPPTSSMLHTTGFSRRRVAAYWSSCMRVRRLTKRSIVQPTRPNKRSSLA